MFTISFKKKLTVLKSSSGGGGGGGGGLPHIKGVGMLVGSFVLNP